MSSPTEAGPDVWVVFNKESLNLTMGEIQKGRFDGLPLAIITLRREAMPPFKMCLTRPIAEQLVQFLNNYLAKT